MTIIPKIYCRCKSFKLYKYGINMAKIFMVIKNIFAVTATISFLLNLNQTTQSIPDALNVVRLLFCTIITNITLITGAVTKSESLLLCLMLFLKSSHLLLTWHPPMSSMQN